MRSCRNGIYLSAVVLLWMVIGATVAGAELVQTFNVTPRMTARGEFKTKIKIRTYDDRGEKAPLLDTAKMRFQKGLKITRSAAKACTVKRLKETAGKRCRPGSRIGTGEAKIDVRPLGEELVEGKVKVFNGLKPRKKGGVATVLLAIESDLSPFLGPTGGSFSQVTIVKATATRDATGPYGLRLDFKVRSWAYDFLEASIAELEFSLGKLKVKKTRSKRRKGGRKTTKRQKINWIEPPTKCSRTWSFEGNFVFRDGSARTDKVEIDCRHLPRR